MHSVHPSNCILNSLMTCIFDGMKTADDAGNVFNGRFDFCNEKLDQKFQLACSLNTRIDLLCVGRSDGGC